MNRRIAAVVFVLTSLYACSVAATERFRPIHGDDVAYGHYLVRLAADVPDADVAALANALAKTYGGRLEVYAAAGFHGFAVVMRPAAARLLSGDARVVLVEEQPTTEMVPGRTAPPPPSVVRAAASVTSAAVPPIPFRAASESSSIEPWSGTYVYDGSGNIKAIGSNRYQYDGVGRLVGATAITSAQSWAQAYQYDAFGNLLTTSVNDGVTPVVAAAVDSTTNRNDQAANCLQGSTCVVGAFDEAGNQTTNGAATYAWDSTSMMSDLQAPGRHDLYLYDADDQRVATVNYTDASTQVWHYTLRDLDEKVVRQLGATVAGGTATFRWERDYVYRGQNLLAVDTNAIRLHFHLDHLGTPRLITDDAGGRRALHTYWPYGLEAVGSDGDAELMKFAGNERDSADPSNASALDYLHARYYGPGMGRFLSVDRGHPKPPLPQTWNRFTYTGDNPLTRFDPTGQDFGAVWEKLKGAYSTFYHSLDYKLTFSVEIPNAGSIEVKSSWTEHNLTVEQNVGTGLLHWHWETEVFGRNGVFSGGNGNTKSGLESTLGIFQYSRLNGQGKWEMVGKIPLTESEGEGSKSGAPTMNAGPALEINVEGEKYWEFQKEQWEAAGLAVDATWDSANDALQALEDASAKVEQDTYNMLVNWCTTGLPVY